MLQKTKVLPSLAIVLVFALMACQKQQEVLPSSPQKQTVNTAREGINEQNCNIALDTAKLFISRYRETVKTEENPLIAYTIPAAGLRALLKRVDENQLDISHVTCYLAINSEGHRTLVYVASKDGADVLKYPKEDYYRIPPPPPTYDQAGFFTAKSVTTPDILTGQ